MCTSMTFVSDAVSSESSFFVSPHRLILKTCGTTLNLLGLPRILEIARTHASFPSVYRCFYSRKSFMFPERQLGPHREWKDEVEFLDKIFPNGSAYTVGKVNGDHWLLYITSPWDQTVPKSLTNGTISTRCSDNRRAGEPESQIQDYTIEILMSKLAPEAREPFFKHFESDSPSDDGLLLSSSIGISDIFPSELTTLDAYSFSPCGYSSNALVNWRDSLGQTTAAKRGEGYYTIHVTPEEGWSYASFECNVPLPICPTRSSSRDDIPDLQTLIRRVVSIFQPGKLTLTLFISNKDNDQVEDEDGETMVDAAQRAFKGALAKTLLYRSFPSGIDGENSCGGRLYKRTDKINYGFGDYDLAFASFEL
jgi:S-adenosylmethionine decarboxylase